MSKIYLNKNVYEASKERMDIIFSEFEKICIAFSGGKDSSVMLNLSVEYARKYHKKIGVMIVDLEGQYKITMDHVRSMLDKNSDVIEPYWICLPINLRNAVSVYQPFWCAWEPELEDKWVRTLPDHPSVISDQAFFPFYKYRMEFEEFVPEFNKWYGDGKKTAMLVGIRSDESLNRFRTIKSTSKKTYKKFKWTTKLGDSNVYNCYPIYDWRTEDIWAANGKFDWDYNKLYDMMYKAGVSIHNQRICQPYGDDQKIGLNLFRVIEPETWAKVVNRVSGANFGNIYCGNKIMGYRKVELPKGHTWRSYTRLLLDSLPPETKASYIDKFVKFVKYWNRKGSAVPDELLGLLPKEAVITDKLTNRGRKNKKIVKYKAIPDALDSAIESKKAAPTWRRMAACILKNDHMCKGLSYAQTKNQTERMKKLVEKYKNL